MSELKEDTEKKIAAFRVAKGVILITHSRVLFRFTFTAMNVLCGEEENAQKDAVAFNMRVAYCH